jgi:butyryl-CoA dehydrogenase
MDFNFSKKQQLIKQTIVDFCEKEVKPYAEEIDHTPRFPDREIKLLSKMGIMGMSIPKEFGGAELDNVSQTIIMEELSKACASTSVTMGAHTSLCCFPLVAYGTKEQKQRFLPKLASGEHLGAFALTEPNAGSDASNVETTAVKDGDEYILNGSKIFITNGGKADIVQIIATTDKSKGHKGMEVFTVETKTKGLEGGKKEDKLGLRGSNTSELILKDVRIPKENLVSGSEGMGFKISMGTFDSGRVGIGVQGVGIGQAAFDEALKYVKEREQFKRKLAKFQAIQFYLADMATRLDAARLLCYRAAFLKDQKKKYSKEAAMAKLYGSEVGMYCARISLQIHGGYGFIKDYPLERFYRDAKITEIYEGTSEIQKLVIAMNLMGKGF